jgi:SPP1 gp7 family putative phage head morphogenesis protein
MPLNAQLLNSSIKNQVYLESIKAQEVNQFTAFLKEMDEDLRSRLLKNDLTDFSRTRLERLLSSIEGSLNKVFDNFYDDLAGHLIELGEYEAEFEALNLNNAIENGFESVIPAPQQVRAAIFTNPLSVRGVNGGKLLEPFIKDWMKADVKLLSGTIRRGFFEGRTNFQIVQDIRGTRAAKYTDGALNVVNRHATAIVRTAVQHSASVGRFETWNANPNVVKGYQWVSTLDGRTSTICRSLDGQTFTIGKGPKPPIHIACRSTTIAKLDPKFAFLSKGRTRASQDGPVDAKLSYYDWLKQQNSKFQDDVLGPTRGNLLRNGGLDSQSFSKLQMGHNFKPMTLAQMRKKETTAFAKAEKKAPLTKQAKQAKIDTGTEQAALTEWLGEERYRKYAGSLEGDRIKKQMNEYGLTQAEGVAMRAYTSTGYEDLNNRQWGVSVANPEAVDESAEVLRSALSKMPSFKGVTYRRTTLPTNVLEKHQVGDVVQYPAFTSSSYDSEVFSGKHRFIIQGHSGKRVGWNSVFNETEREVVHTSPTDFIVEKSYIDKDGILTFELTEI